MNSGSNDGRRKAFEFPLNELRELASLFQRQGDAGFCRQIADSPVLQKAEGLGLVQVRRDHYGVSARLVKKGSVFMAKTQPSLAATSVVDYYANAPKEVVRQDLTHVIEAISMIEDALAGADQSYRSLACGRLLYIGILPPERFAAAPERCREFLAMAAKSDPLGLMTAFKGFPARLRAHVNAANLVLDCGAASRFDLQIATHLHGVHRDLQAFWKLVLAERRVRIADVCGCARTMAAKDEVAELDEEEPVQELATAKAGGPV